MCGTGPLAYGGTGSGPLMAEGGTGPMPAGHEPAGTWGSGPVAYGGS
jgi:hypothetical protein